MSRAAEDAERELHSGRIEDGSRQQARMVYHGSEKKLPAINQRWGLRDGSRRDRYPMAPALTGAMMLHRFAPATVIVA